MTKKEKKYVDILSYAVYRCPNKCKEPGMDRPVEERAALFNGNPARPIRKESLPLCSVCGSAMKKITTFNPKL